MWRLSTLDKAIPTSRRSEVTLRCTHSKQKYHSSVVTNTQQILATYKIYILSWKSVVETTPVIWIFRTSVPEGTPITIWTTVVTTTQKAVIWNDNIQNLHVVIPHINGEAVNHSATKRQPKKHLFNCWQMLAEIDLVRHCIYWCFMILITVSPSCKFAS